MTRLGSVHHGQHEADRAILGAEGGAVWVLVNQLVLVSQTDGRILGDASMIEARNAVALRSRFPINRQAFNFERGLVITVPSGARLRVDPRSLTAQPIETAEMASEAVAPVILLPANQPPKTRSVQFGDDWLGLVTDDERAAYERGTAITEQDYALPTRYRLATAQQIDQRDATGAVVRRLRSFVPLQGSVEFSAGGLLVLDNQRGGFSALMLGNPRRLLVLHQDAAGEAAEQRLTCMGVDGKICWRAGLGLTSVAGGLPIGDGQPASWSVLLVGRGTGKRDADDRVNAIVRVGLQDGVVSRVDIRALDVAGIRPEQDR